MRTPAGADPITGGELSKTLHRLRDDIQEKRRRRLAERRKQPSMAEFYAGRSVFLTGGSGFLGRMLVEQLLRTCPDIGTIYLLLRTKRGEAPEDRLRGLLDVALFDRLRAEQPGALSKLVVVPGDITELELGMSRAHQDLLRKEVSVVFHVAASVRFDDPFQKAVFTNLRSTREMVELARGMPQLKALVHVSTAYTNVNRDPVGEEVYPTHLDWKNVIRMAEEMDAASLWAMDCLGPKLRDFHPNTYTFTKALAEKLVDDVADELPVVIVRPSIVTPSFKDPIPGWIDNLYGLGAFWAGGIKGLIRAVHVAEDFPFDSVPADVVTKITILASWARALKCGLRPPTNGSNHKPKPKGVEVVNATVGKIGCSYQDMQWVLDEATNEFACTGMIRDPKVSMTNSYLDYWVQHWYHHVLYGVVLDVAARLTRRKPRAVKLYRNMMAGFDAIARFRKEYNFASENQQHLLAIMHPDDEEAYCIMDLYSARDDVESFRQWGLETARGVLMYALKEEVNPDNRKNIPKLKMAMKLYHGAFATAAGVAAYCLVPT